MGKVRPRSQHTVRRFPGGARRSDRKPRFDLIPFEFLESVAEVLTAGAVKYGPYNWKRGREDFFPDAWNHAFVHLQKFKEGDRSEDHLAPGVQRGVPDLGGEEGRNLAGGFHSLDVGRSPNSLIGWFLHGRLHVWTPIF